MILQLAVPEVRRLIASLRKAQEWDDSVADSMTFCGGQPMKGFRRWQAKALRSALANDALREKVAQQLAEHTGARIEFGSATVTAAEQSQWQELLEDTGLRAADLTRSAFRLMVIIREARKRGAKVVVREQDGAEESVVFLF